MSDTKYNDDSECIRSVLGMSKIKYSVLDTLNIQSIDSIHIDIFGILKLLKSFDDIEYDPYAISSSIFNIAAHYKRYFTKRANGVRLYLYYKPTDDEFVSKDGFKDAIKITKAISAYIPGLYFIDLHKLSVPTSIAIKYFCDSGNSLIITRSKMHHLLVNENTSLLRINRDKSTFFSKETIFKKLSDDENIDMPVSLLPIIYSFIGIPGMFKGIKGMGIKKTLKLIKKAIYDNLIVDNYTDMDLFLHDINTIKSFNIETKNLLIKNFSIINKHINSKCYMTPLVKEKLDSCIIDKFAKKDLMMLNTKYFSGLNSIMLNELVESPKKNKSKWGENKW